MGGADWILPDPFVVKLAVAAGDIDAFGHVNNAVYVAWLDRAAWAHSSALGVTVERCVELARGMAVVRTTIQYDREAFEGDQLNVATWLVPGKRPLTIARRFQILRVADGAPLLHAEIEYACIDLRSGRPARWPALFQQAYVPTAAAGLPIPLGPPA
jgi:acyl-CoA thioester hydrolase